MIAPPRLLRPPATLDTPGGFLWWYLDLVDDDGNGMVLIYSFGLPFLPGITAAARAGSPALPSETPAVNVVVYRNGRPDFYLLQTVAPEDASWEGDRWQIGGLSAQLTGEEQLTLTVDLDCDVPGTADRLTGQVRLTGPLRQSDTPGASGMHSWTPLLVAAVGEADLRCGDQQWHLRGRAYFDRNQSDRPLHELGIRRWWWFRLALPDAELIGYHLVSDEPTAPLRSLCLVVDLTGQTQTISSAQMEMIGHRRSLCGLSYPGTITISLPDHEPVTIHLAHLVDSGPFYQRFQIEAHVGGKLVRGFAEQVVPGRLDQAWSRPFVRMAVHQHNGGNSMWLPLFSGPRTGRLARLLGDITGRPQLTTDAQ